MIVTIQFDTNIKDDRMDLTELMKRLINVAVQEGADSIDSDIRSAIGSGATLIHKPDLETPQHHDWAPRLKLSECIDCQSSAHPHASGGRCSMCYAKYHYKQKHAPVVISVPKDNGPKIEAYADRKPCGNRHCPWGPTDYLAINMVPYADRWFCCVECIDAYKKSL